MRLENVFLSVRPIVGSAGSFSAGVHGRKQLTNELSLLASVAYTLLPRGRLQHHRRSDRRLRAALRFHGVGFVPAVLRCWGVPMRHFLPVCPILLLGTFITSCWPASSETVAMQTTTHPNGLVLTSSKTLSVISQTQDGYILDSEKARGTRYPVDIRVRLESGSEPVGSSQSRVINGNRVHYRIETDSGGSGGEGHTMTAWRRCSEKSDKHVLVIQYTQVEWPENPDFEETFRILGHVSCHD